MLPKRLRPAMRTLDVPALSIGFGVPIPPGYSKTGS